MSNYVPSGTIYLLTNIKIDNSYNDEYYFTSATDQYNFFHDSSRILKSFTNSTYQRKNKNTLTLQCNADEIRTCNYLMWQNQDTTKWYYAFVTSVDYENPNTTIINYQLDVYQTYLFDLNWRESFVERMHCRRWVLDEDDDAPNGYIYDEPEDLEYGTDYDTVADLKVEYTKGVYYAILASNRNVGQEAVGSNYAVNLEYYVVPFYYNVDVPNALKLFSVDDFQLAPLQSILYIFKNAPDLVNSLVSVYITSMAPGNLYVASQYLEQSVLPLYGGGTLYDITRWTYGGNQYQILHIKDNLLTYNLKQYSYYTADINLFQFLPEYLDHDNYDEPKLMEFPYTFLELTNDRGESKILKLQNFGDGSLMPYFISIWFSLNVSPSHMEVAIPMRYLNDTGLASPKILDNIFIDTSDTSLPINDDYCASYLQANSNSINVAKSNAQAFYDTAMGTSQATYNTLMKNMNITGGSKLGNILVGGLGGIANIMLGNTVGAVNSIEGMLTGGISMSELAKQQNTYDTNLANAQAEALTSYETSIASTLAKVRDAEQVSPQTKNIGQNSLFYLTRGGSRIKIKIKTIRKYHRKKLVDYFHMYGYKVNRLTEIEVYPYSSGRTIFNTRSAYNYIKMTQANVSGNIPNDDLKTIKGIFQKGITLWHNAYVHNYYQTNVDFREPYWSELKIKNDEEGIILHRPEVPNCKLK